jgi:hypothetical protein
MTTSGQSGQSGQSFTVWLADAHAVARVLTAGWAAPTSAVPSEHELQVFRECPNAVRFRKIHVLFGGKALWMEFFIRELANLCSYCRYAPK